MRHKHKTNAINGQFAPRTIEMLKSPAMRVMSLSARRALDRIEIELAAHAGKDNGSLIVTHTNFVDHGIQHNAVSPGVRELEGLGFIQVFRGRAGNGPQRRPNMYRLTYRPTDNGPPTDEWRLITSEDDAKAIVRKARKTPNLHYRKPVAHRYRKAVALPLPETGS
jgi:hypothetical protein